MQQQQSLKLVPYSIKLKIAIQINKQLLLIMSNQRKYASEKLLEIHPQSNLDHLMSNSLQLIDQNTTFNTKLILTFANVISDISQTSCTKMQLARRFQLIIQQKQRQVRSQIGKINSKNLVYLQQKINTISKKNKVINQLKQQVKTNEKTIKQAKKENEELQLNIQKMKLQIEEKQNQVIKLVSIQNTLKLNIEQLQTKYNLLFQKVEYEEEIRIKLKNQLNKYQFNQQNWEQRIQFLLQSRENSLRLQYEGKIKELQELKIFKEHQINQLKHQNHDAKLKYQLLKQEILYSLQAQKSKGDQKLTKPKFVLKTHKEVQTLQNSIKMIDFSVNIAIECQQCKKIADVAKYIKNFSIHDSTQTQQIVKYFQDTSSQTLFKFLQPAQQLRLIKNVQSLKQLSEKKQNMYFEKQKELLQIIQNSPSREDDLARILSYQNQCQNLKLYLAYARDEITSINTLNKSLFSKIQDMKLNQDESIQVKSKQYKANRNNYDRAKTLPIFFDKLVQNNSIILIHEENTPKYSQTVQLNPKNDMSCIFKNKRVKTANSTRQTSRSIRNSNKMVSQLHNKTLSNFEYKVKNPQYFSASPNINLKRRQYKKYSLLKAKG